MGQITGNDREGANHGGRHRSRLKDPISQGEHCRVSAGPPHEGAGCAVQRRAGALGAPRLSLLNLGVTDRPQ